MGRRRASSPPSRREEAAINPHAKVSPIRHHAPRSETRCESWRYPPPPLGEPRDGSVGSSWARTGASRPLLNSAKIAKRSLVGSVPMDNLLSKGATDWREGRRLRAFELKQQGWTQQRIAEALGVSKGAVSQWMKRARDGGGAESFKAPTRSWSTAAPERGAACQGARASGAGSRGARLSRRRVDVRAGGDGDPKGVRGRLPPGSREPSCSKP